MTQTTVAAWAEKNAPLLSWGRAFVVLLGAVASVGATWALLATRVAAAEVAIAAHERRLHEQAAEIQALKQGHRDLSWNIYVVCTLQAQQQGITSDTCRRPPEK